MIIERARVEDAAEILALQKLAYASEAEIYNDYNIQPLRQTEQEIIEEVNTRMVIVIRNGGKIVGSARAYFQQGTCFVGKLIVHPEYQNRGIGSYLMAGIEKTFSGADRFELFTGHKSQRNLHLYNKLGYQEFKREKVNEKLTQVFMEKRRNLTSA